MLLNLNLETLADRLADKWRRLTGQRKKTRKVSRCGLVIETLETRELLTTYTVNTNLDEIASDNTTSLREAVELANAHPGEDTIDFSEEANGSIDLVFGQLQITDSVTIRGNGATHTVINGQQSSRVFDVTAAVEFVLLDSLTVTNGQTTGNGEKGGGIRSLAGMLNVFNCAITGNSTTGSDSDGGGLFAQNGSISIIASTISNNSTSGSASGGGGVQLMSGILNVQNSTVSGNSSAATDVSGGGLTVDGGVLAVSSSTIAFNSSAGTTASGGGIFVNNCDVTLVNSIIARNTNAGAPDFSQASGTLSIVYTLIGNNFGTILGAASTPDGNGNLIGTNVTPIDPLLGPLTNNGGSTQTHALQATSPAIDRGADGLASDFSDQRGSQFIRIAGASVDMGSFERQALSLQVTTADDENDATFDPDDLSLREALALVNAYPGTDTITFASFLDGVPLPLTLGELTITDTVRINGSGIDLTVLDAQSESRAFNITNTAGNVTLHGLSITNGKTTGDGEGGGGIRSASTGTLTLSNVNVSGSTTEGAAAPGGGIYLGSASTLMLTNSAFSGNMTLGTGSGGGGIYAAAGGTLIASGTRISSNSTTGDASPGGGLYWNAGSVTLTESIIADNTTQGSNSTGGGISSNLANVTITDTTVSGNSTSGASSSGGGLFAQQATVALYSSTVSDNSTQGANSAGGGIHLAAGALTLVNSTIAGNATVETSAVGGGLSVGAASLSLTNSTVAFNSATGTTHGGGISAITGAVTLLNSIVAKNSNSGAPDLAPGSGTLVVSFTLIGDRSGTGLTAAPLGFPDADGNLIGTGVSPIDPQLGSLAAFGGPTKTFPLQGISPAINAGDNSLVGTLIIDQRGLPRIFEDDVDMGAFEYQSAAVAPIVAFTVANQSAAESAGSIVITVTLSIVSPNNVTIPLLIDGTATATDDYTISTSTLIIPAGSTSGTFTVTIVDDAVFEASETVVLTMGTITNGIVGGLSEHTLTITNNDTVPSVGLSSASQSVAENGGVVSIIVNLSAAVGVDTTIPFTLNGSAGNPGDYTPGSSSPIVILAGSTTATIEITIVDDAVSELNETLIVSLGTPSSGTLGAIAVQTVTINDNDNDNIITNAPPVLGSPGPAPHYRHNPRSTRAPVNVLSQITVSDPDGTTQLGRLVISISIPPGKNRDVVSYTGASALGTLTSATVNGRRELTFNLLPSVTSAQVQTFLRSVKFSTSRGGLGTANREFRVSVTDRGGLTSNVVTQNVAVSKD